LIDLSIYNIDVIDLSEQQMIIGEIINEGNEDALFGFVTVEPIGNSNIKKTTQFIDEIETDSPVPFNIPIEFDGEPQYGEHDIKITIRYKDDVRDEHFIIHDATVLVKEPSNGDNGSPDLTMIIIPIILAIGAGIYIMRRRKKAAIEAS